MIVWTSGASPNEGEAQADSLDRASGADEAADQLGQES